MLNTKKWLTGVIAGVFTVGLAVPALAEDEDVRNAYLTV
jgi:hypothetical protein